jgi:hypothetical protein
MKSLRVSILLLSIFISNSCLSSSNSNLTSDSIKDKTNNQEIQKDVDKTKLEVTTLEDNYRALLNNLSEDVDNELLNYRKKLIETNKEKVSLYRKLTQESQEFLKKENNYKKKLPNKIVMQAQKESNTTENKNIETTKTTSIPTITPKKQEILDEYKIYLSTVKEYIIKEIIEYRKACININNKKKQYYNNLSLDTKNFLIKEKEFKKELNVKKMKVIRDEVMLKKASK